MAFIFVNFSNFLIRILHDLYMILAVDICVIKGSPSPPYYRKSWKTFLKLDPFVGGPPLKKVNKKVCLK